MYQKFSTYLEYLDDEDQLFPVTNSILEQVEQDKMVIRRAQAQLEREKLQIARGFKYKVRGPIK
jgi:hypothetical protein